MTTTRARLLPRSIRLRLLLALMAMLAVVALVMGALTYRNVLAETEALFDYQLRQMALSLRDQGEIPSSQADALADEQFDFVVQIWSVDGRSIYATRDHADLPGRVLLGLADVSAGGRTWRTFSVATRDRVIQVAQPVRIRRQLAVNAALRSVAPILLLAPVMALVAWWVVAATLAPLRRVAADVRQRGEQWLQPLPGDGLPSEVEPLVSALNALLQRLGTSLDTQRAFVADAAHELRSPLTALKLQLQWLQRAPDEAARAGAIASLSEGIDRSARLVEQLLALARSEPGAAETPEVNVDLGELVRQAVADTVPFALSRGTRFELSSSDTPVRLRGHPAALGAMARNLADNAVRYSPPGARVAVQVSMDGPHPTLVVEDSGPGIPAEEQERVFDRFYRRADTAEAGSGLGLAIVQSVARRHGAEVRLGTSGLGGLRVVVRFAA
jgi:signal transduction histidine kinase